MLHNKLFYAFGMCLLFACTKPQITDVASTNNSANAVENTAAITKIKTIERSVSGVTTNRYTFIYHNGRVDSIKHQALVRGGENFYIKVLYPGAGTTPSGYHFSKQNGNFNVIATFLVQNGKIIKKTKTPDFSNPFEQCDTAAANDYTFQNTKLIKNKPSFNNAPLYDGLITIDYNALKNVKQTKLLGGNQETITAKKYDDKENPFAMQNKLLYYISLRPFNAFKKTEEYLFDFINLTTNNPVKFSFIDNGGTRVTGYKLTYTYNAADLPTQIIVSKTDLSNPATPPAPYTEVERIRITY